MATLKIEHDVENSHEAIEFLGYVVGRIEQGYIKGQGWEYETGYTPGNVFTPPIPGPVMDGQESKETSESEGLEPGDGSEVENEGNATQGGSQEATDES
jgi:hypothetical protein